MFISVHTVPMSICGFSDKDLDLTMISHILAEIYEQLKKQLSIMSKLMSFLRDTSRFGLKTQTSPVTNMHVSISL